MLKQIFKPKYTLPIKDTLKGKIIYLFKSYLLLLLLLIGLGLILNVIDITLVHIFHNQPIIKGNIVNDSLRETYGTKIMFLIIVVAGPILEECIFRLPLNLNITNISISISIIIYRCLVKHIFKFDPHSLVNYLKVIVAFIAFFIIKSGLSRLPINKI